MAATYTVKTAKNAGEKDNPHGGKLVKWYLTVTDPQGTETADVYCQKKPGNDLSPGMEIYGRLEQGEYGWRLFPEQDPNTRQNGSGGSSDTRDEAWFYAKDMRISRAGILQAVVSGIPFKPADDLQDYIAQVNRITDALLASLDERTPHPSRTPSATPGGGNNGSGSPPVPAATVAGPAPSDKQLAFLEKLLQEAGVDVQDRLDVKAWAAENLTGGQNGTASTAIEAAKSGDEGISRLLTAAQKWVAEQPTVPGDERDLQPAPAAVMGGDDSDIPF